MHGLFLGLARRRLDAGFHSLLVLLTIAMVIFTTPPAAADTYSVGLSGSGNWLQNGATYSGTFIFGMVGTWEIDLDDSLWPDSSDSTARFDYIWDTFFAPNYDASVPGAESWRGYFDGTTLPQAPQFEFSTTSPGGILAGDASITVLVRDWNADGILDQNEKHDDLQCTMTVVADPLAGTGAFASANGWGSMTATSVPSMSP